MRTQIIWAIIKKDLKDVRSSTMLIGPVFIPQTATCFLLPAVFMILTYVLKDKLVAGLPFLTESLTPLYNIPQRFSRGYEKIAYIFANFSFIPLLALMPLQAAMVIAANSFIGEKERKTLETLLYSPVRNGEFVLAKLMTVLVPSVLLTFAECLIYYLICNGLSYIFGGYFILIGSALFLTAFIFSPAVSFFGLTLIMLISIKAKSHAEADFISGLFVLPFASLMVAQVSALYKLTGMQIIISGIIMTLIGVLLILKAAPRFERENIIKTF